MKENTIHLLSVFCLVYNHKDFIARAIEGMLMQKTDFKFEIVIGEDNSTDGSREIVFEYAEKYPEMITVVTSEVNVGMKANAARTKKMCTGKYIAFCEGDDYWTYPLKLQTQVDFLETNPDFSLCFHNAILLWDDKSRQPDYFCSKDQKLISTTEDVISSYFIPTASMVLRTEYFHDFPDWFKDVYNGDWGTQLIFSTKGKIRYFDDLMSVYRKNAHGLSGSAGKKREYIKGKMIELLINFNEYTNYKFEKNIKKRIQTIEEIHHDFKQRKKNKFLYWLMRPQKVRAKLFNTKRQG